MVLGIQNYYQIATNISKDAGKLNRAVMTVITNKLKGISRNGRKLTPSERTRYGKSVMLRYRADEPIYPIGYVQHKFARCNSNQAHDEVIDELPLKLLRQKLFGRSLEYANNRISLYAAQKGLCAVTGEKFTSTDEIHCHHKIPKSQGGTDEYQNLILVTATVHKLIHATNADTIQKYLQACIPNFKKLNVLRQKMAITFMFVILAAISITHSVPSAKSFSTTILSKMIFVPTAALSLATKCSGKSTTTKLLLIIVTDSRL